MKKANEGRYGAVRRGPCDATLRNEANAGSSNAEGEEGWRRRSSGVQHDGGNGR